MNESQNAEAHQAFRQGARGAGEKKLIDTSKMKSTDIDFKQRLSLSVFYLMILSALIVSCDSRRQKADASFNTKVAHPAYGNEHPKVLFDEAHHNIHTASGLYKPFADLITNDGYQVTRNKEPFSQKTLGGYCVLIIANALGVNESNDDPAFTEDECNTVRDWVQASGSLLLITDHAPTGAAAENLAKRFGVEMSKGMTEDSTNYDNESGDTSQLVFTRGNGLLLEHPIAQGRDASEKINKVMTFTGQSLKAPENGAALLKLGESARNRAAMIKVEKSGGDTRVLINYGTPVPATGYAQAIALQFDKGRVVVLGEAAMLTAQLDGKTNRPFGMNVQGIDNRQFALNIMHWLTRLL